MEDEIRITESLTIRIDVFNPLYQYFAEQIAALKSLKNNEVYSKSHAINIMYVPILTMFIESCISGLVEECLHNVKDKCEDSLKVRLIEGFKDPLNKGWKQYRDTFKIVFGYSFESIVNHETVKAVGFLFELRNKLIHGRQFTYQIDMVDTEDEQTSWGDDYKKLHEYFVEKKLTESRSEDVVSTLVNDKVVDHFLLSTVNFVETVVNKVCDEHNLLLHVMFKAHVMDKLVL